MKKTPLHKLGTFFLHGTAIKKVAKILSEGLRMDAPHVFELSTRQVSDRKWNLGVYLTQNIDNAIAYAEDATHYVKHIDLNRRPGEPKTKDVCILVLTNIEQDFEIGGDGFGDYMVNRNVPPMYIQYILTVRRKYDRWNIISRTDFLNNLQNNLQNKVQNKHMHPSSYSAVQSLNNNSIICSGDMFKLCEYSTISLNNLRMNIQKNSVSNAIQ